MVYTTRPITLRHPSVSLEQLYIVKGSILSPAKVRSQRLLPEIENTELSFRQKTKRFFGFSKVPKFWFQVLVESSSVVQFENPEVLQISLRIETLKGDNQTRKIIQDIQRQIQINCIKIRIKSWTTIKACENPNSGAKTDKQGFDLDFHFEHIFKDLASPLVANSLDNADETLPIRDMFQLVLRKDVLYINGK
ncbi:hypothetical protein N7495_007423 [Penicillium taxi]|uniref:uncharacterized protein n=1 Tax=Penicillium taxi TaxID=168475 RepID=UPI0025458422|nr:uncharacterized protein N7495_007423 [Penicillium taxi]KAJ5887382.1 hypothetical protein N7495_007423 [Penicillium taxi]